MRSERIARSVKRAVLVTAMTTAMAAAITPTVALAETPSPQPPGAQSEQTDGGPATGEGVEQVLGRFRSTEALAPGVTHRQFTTTESAGQVIGDVVEVDLTQPGVAVDLLNPGTVAATAPVKAMADAAGAVAGINGDFFDISATGAPAGPAVKGGRAVKAAVPQGRRAAPAVPGAEMDYVYAIGADGRGRIDRLPLEGEVSGAHGTYPIVAFNQYAVPVGGIAVFTAAWGRDRAQTLCGNDDDAKAPCARDRWEIAVKDQVVTRVGPAGATPIRPGEIVLAGRDNGARMLRSYQVGEPADVEYELTPASGIAPRAAVGGQPILVNGKPTERLDDRIRAPRSAVGNSRDGRHIFLVTVDGRQSDSVGATLAEMSALLAQVGADDAVNLDGGGSSTLVYRQPGARTTAIVNDPSGSTARRVGDGLGVFVRPSTR